MAAVKKLLLLDLDNTLWDFDSNAEEALSELFHRHRLHIKSGFSVHEFVALYQIVNKTYWKRYEKGEIGKDFLRTARFTDTFTQMGIPEMDHPERVWEEYLEICPMMTRLIPGALRFLGEMKELFSIGLVTNGFEKTQNLKIKHSGIGNYIDFMLTSESIGIPKPNPEIFFKALKMADAEADSAIYVGDTWDTDVIGGINAGIQTIWFNRTQNSAPVIAAGSSKFYLGSASSLIEVGAVISNMIGK